MSPAPRRPTNSEWLAFAEGRLGPRAAAQVAAYLRENPGEIDRIRAYILQDAHVREAHAAVLAEPVPERLRAVVERARRARARFRRRAGAAAVAGLAVGLTAWGSLGPASGPGDRVRPQQDFGSIALEAYRAGTAVDALPSPHAAPDLTPFGLVLERIRSLEHGRLVVTEYTYRDADRRRVALYESQPPVPVEARPPGSSGQPGVPGQERASPGHLIEWVEGNRHLAVIGERSPIELERIARHAGDRLPTAWPAAGVDVPAAPGSIVRQEPASAALAVALPGAAPEPTAVVPPMAIGRPLAGPAETDETM